ncbi:MAG: D-alanine--D-alanine ligase family protein [bacterium]|nr:D-alanine--D-alanine ligase family protein [bacterium]
MACGRLRVGVIFGGRSGEHEVSLISARSILRALDPSRFEAVPIAITREGRWLLAGDALKALEAGSTDLRGQPVALLGDPACQGLVPLEGRGIAQQLDVVFPVLHGPHGEDGTIQGLLELANLPYVGAGVLGSALGMDKAVQKALLDHRGIPVADYIVVRDSVWRSAPDPLLDAVAARMGYPCFVKPANLGSSIGITKVKAPEALPAAIELAFRYDRKALVEEAVAGREIEVSVLGNEEPEASVCGEILPSREFYDYQAKYVDNSSRLIIPADLPPEVSQEVRRLAVASFLALEASGMARVDFLVALGPRRIIVNELNTIPGFTPISMYPKLWEASGVAYPELITRLIELALERHEAKLRLDTTYHHQPPG